MVESAGRANLEAVNSCQVRAKYLGTQVARESYLRKGVAGSVDFVWWNLDIFKSVGANCPTNGNTKIRIRSADFSGSIKSPSIRYPLELSSPELDSVISAQLRWVAGKDSLLNRDYQEWILVSVDVE